MQRHTKRVLTPRAFRAAALFLFSALLALRFAGAIAAQDAGSIHWEQLSGAQVKLDDKTPLTWNVYQPEKKDKKDKKNANLVLMLLGHRYLLIDLKARMIYEVPKASLHAQGQDFDSDDLTQGTHAIPNSDWSSRDVGPAQLVQMTMGDYNRVLQVQLPHPPDLRAFY